MAAGGRAPYGIVVDHDYSGGLRPCVLEGLLDLLEVALVDVPYHPEVPEAAGERPARDAMCGVAPGDYRPRHLQGRVELRGDVPGVPEVVGSPSKVEVAGDSPYPTYIMVAGDDDDGGGLADLV